MSEEGVYFYTRPGCHLCEPVGEILRQTRERHGFPLRTLNVEDDPELESRWGRDVPVVEIRSPRGTRIFRHSLDPGEFETELQRLWIQTT